MADALIDSLINAGLYDLLRLRLVREIPLPQPLAGAEVRAVVPGGVIWEVLALRSTLTTSAVVANRVASVAITDADGVLTQRYFSTRSQAASGGAAYTFAAGLGASVANSGSDDPMPAPPPVALAGWTVATLTALLDVGDQWSSGVLLVREWSPQQIAVQAQWIERQWPSTVANDEGGS